MANPIVIVGVLGALAWAFLKKKPVVTPGGPAPASPGSPGTPGSGGLVPITPLKPVAPAMPRPSGVHDFPAGPNTDEPSEPDPDDPRLDSDLPAALRAAILGVLEDPTSTADQLNQAADAAEEAGHPIAAASLRAAAQAKSFVAAPPVNPGATAPQANPGDDPGILPDLSPATPAPVALDPNLLGNAVAGIDAIANKAIADAQANGDDSGDDGSFDPSQAMNAGGGGFSAAPAPPGQVTNDGDGSSGDATGDTIDSVLSGLGF